MSDPNAPDFLEKLGHDVSLLKDTLGRLVAVVEALDTENENNPLADRFLRTRNREAFQRIKADLNRTQAV